LIVLGLAGYAACMGNSGNSRVAGPRSPKNAMLAQKGIDLGKLLLKTLTSVESLRAAVDSWDDLWLRSEVKLPVARAETVAQWLDHFAPRCAFTGLLVEEDDRLVAALPLFSAAPWPFHIWRLPGNPWSPAGELLLDPESDVDRGFDTLIDALAQLPGLLLRFDAVVTDSLRWQALESALNRRKLSCADAKRFEIARVSIGDDWQEYLASRGGNHRRHMGKALRRARSRGLVELQICRPTNLDELERLLRQAFEIEDRCWKGREASSVLKSPGIFEFFLKQAALLSRENQCEVLFLNFDGQPIAFEYAWTAKQTYFSPKVGYDERYEDVTPGQLLRYLHYEQLHAGEEINEVDYIGPLSGATAKWATNTYTIGRLFIAPDRILSRLAISMYRHVWRRLKKLKSSLQVRKSASHYSQFLQGQAGEQRKDSSKEQRKQSDSPGEIVSV